jgi:Base plate wedge protein 53
MSRPYFRQVPNYDYVSRNADEKNISDYVEVKNLFKRGKLREDIFGNLSFFTKYDIIGDERPDNVAYKNYKDPTLDWVILLANNILNVQTEWPLTQQAFDKVMFEKYGDYDTLYNGIHHYESREIKNSSGITIVPAGLEVDSDYSVSYYDNGQEITVSDIAQPITNFDYENNLEENKRHIYVLKPQYLNVVFNDMDTIMPYKKGGAQYVNSTLKKADNIRLYQ